MSAPRVTRETFTAHVSQASAGPPLPIRAVVRRSAQSNRLLSRGTHAATPHIADLRAREAGDVGRQGDRPSGDRGWLDGIGPVHEVDVHRAPGATSANGILPQVTTYG